MKILIAGGSGFLGKYVTDLLYSDNELLVLGRNQEKEFCNSFKQKQIPYIFCDYSLNSLGSIIKMHQPDAIINLASHRPATGKNYIHDFYINLQIAGNIYEAALQNGVENIIDTSTRMIYSQENKLPWKENEFVNPKTYYALSKLWIENTALTFIEKGLKVKILRLAQIIGLGEKAGYVLQIYLEKAIKKEPITVFGKGVGRRHYVYAKDIAGCIKTILTKHPKSTGIYNLGMNKTYSFHNIAKIMNYTFQNDAEIILNEDKPADENIYEMSIQKIKKEFNWQPEFDLDRTYEDIKSDIENGWFEIPTT